MFILSTYADGMYWPSAIEPLLYPKGCSFYRPFSYRKEYISPSLLEIFKDYENVERYLSDKSLNVGVFGIRFREKSEPEYRGVFIPLRSIALTSVHITDTIQINFRLNDYVKLSSDSKLQTIALDGLVDYKEEEFMLLLDVPSNKGNLLESLDYQQEFPSGLWDRLADDDSVSPCAKENFIGTAVLRLVQILERGETASIFPKLLWKSNKNQGLFGYELKMGKIYDFDFAYSRIVAPKQSKKQISFDYAFTSPNEHFDVSRDRIIVTGNYRRELIWIKPKVGRPGPSFLEWTGMNKTDKGVSADPSEDKVMDFRLPVKLLDRFWSPGRIKDAIFGSISLIAAIFFFWQAIKALPLQSAQIFTAIGAGAMGLFGGFLKDFMKKLSP